MARGQALTAVRPAGGAAGTMGRRARRGLTGGERSRLSPGLLRALDEAGAQLEILNRVHPAARLAALRFGAPPILARPGALFWPDALTDYAGAPPELFATLQHELQHLLDYATGALTGLGYVLRPRDWSYRYDLRPASRWSDFGAEQRASIAEHFWLVEEGRADLVVAALGRRAPPRELYRRVLPWADLGPSPGRLAP